MSKVRWVMSYEFCSKFHKLQQCKNFENRLRFDEGKVQGGGNFFETQCIRSPSSDACIVTKLNGGFDHLVLSQYTRLTDRRTDGIATAIPCVALHAVAR